MKSSNYIIIGVLLIISFLGVNGWSLWLDESSTAMLASIPSFNGLVETMINWNGSESQMPLYILFMWIWEKLFGHTEYALRMSNVFMVVVFLVYCAYCIKRMCKEDAMIIKIAMSCSVIAPFFIYNMNEARVNISLFVLSAICYLGVFMYGKYKYRKDLYVCLISLATGFGFNMLFAFVVPILLLEVLYFDKKVLWNNKRAIAITFVGCCLIGSYYVWTLLQAKSGFVERPGVTNIAYAMYEFLGMNGMGAPKNVIRESDNLIVSIKPYIPWLIAICIGYAMILWRMLVEKAGNQMLMLFVISIIVFFIGAYAASFRFWGRHLFIFYPLWIAAFAGIINKLWESRKWINKITVCYCLLCIFVSFIRISILPEYKKENIKETIHFVNNWNKEKAICVFFAGFPELANYYHLENQCNLDKMEDSNNGVLVYIKSMKVAYGGKNPYYLPDKFNYRVIKSDETCEIYEFMKK